MCEQNDPRLEGTDLDSFKAEHADVKAAAENLYREVVRADTDKASWTVEAIDDLIKARIRHGWSE